MYIPKYIPVVNRGIGERGGGRWAKKVQSIDCFYTVKRAVQ